MIEAKDEERDILLPKYFVCFVYAVSIIVASTNEKMEGSAYKL